MDEICERVAMANSAIKKLNERHAEFLDFVDTNYGEKQTPIGELKRGSHSLSVICLGFKLNSTHKLILGRDGYPIAIEYLFTQDNPEINTSIFKMYLSMTGGLLLNIKEEPSPICWWNNDQTLSYSILNAIAEKMLDSNVFSPTES